MTHETVEQKGSLSQWMARLRDFSPFAFASPALEQQYQDYQSAHVGSHVGTMCWLLGIMWAGIRMLALHRTINYPRAWMFNIPVAVCMAVGVFGKYAPALFRNHWHMCAWAITATQALLYDEAYTFLLTLRRGSGRLRGGSLLQLDFTRFLTSLLLAVGCPLSLPAWGFVQAVTFATPNFSLPGKSAISWGAQCLPVPWFVFSALQGIVIAYSGPGAILPEFAWCRVRIVFWRVQMEVLAAVVGVLRDVAWRRSFLRDHPHLIGHNGAARAAVWPFGSNRTLVTCVGLVMWLLSIDIMAVDFWVSAIIHGVKSTVFM
jgi:hypothetical protein